MARLPYTDLTALQLFTYAFTARACRIRRRSNPDRFFTVPLATLVSATKPPRQPTSSAILSPNGMKRFFVVHGGLFSKDGVTLDDIRAIDRHGKQPGNDGLMCELLWTDPQEENGRGPSKRGVGISFGPDVTRRWCTLNGITGVLRSHEVRQDGYQIEHDGLCTTVRIFPPPCFITVPRLRLLSTGVLRVAREAPRRGRAGCFWP